MIISELSVTNYKCLRDVKVNLSNFTCIIGHNNAGKSTLIQSLALLFDAKRLTPAHYYNPDQDIVIAANITDISEDDLQMIPDLGHRKQIQSALIDSSIKLVRRYDPIGQSKLKWKVLIPKDERFKPEHIESVLKGKPPSVNLANNVINLYPELNGQVDHKSNLTHIRSLISKLSDSQPAEAKVEEEVDISPGNERSLRLLLPEPIYIPAMKDASDDIKTKDSSSFGKLIGMLLTAITPKLKDVDDSLKKLNAMLNFSDSEGSDSRLPFIQKIESTIRTFVQDQFSAIKIDLQVPPPNLKTILSNAQVQIDDGIKGGFESKGDGLKRSVAFAVIRSIAHLQRDTEFTPEDNKKTGVLLLFEEPELYLHPKAQRILFDALRTLSKHNQVVVSTHSPLFFSTSSTDTFIKMRRTEPTHEHIPHGTTLQINTRQANERMHFQMLNFELSNIAFFSQTIVLVEGPTDHIVFPHMARVLNPDWCVIHKDISIHRVNGKGNILHYTELLKQFGVRVVILADLDCLLGGFNHLNPRDKCRKLQSQLRRSISNILQQGVAAGLYGDDNEELDQQRLEREPEVRYVSTTKQMSSRKIRNQVKNDIKISQWNDLITKHNEVLDKRATINELQRAADAFFDKQITANELSILESGEHTHIESLKHNLLISLRECDIFILSNGAIEKYLPRTLTGKKTARAIAFCDTIHDPTEILASCHEVPVDHNGTMKNEIEWIFKCIFEDQPTSGNHRSDATADLTSDPNHA